jgi:hypothetical protein
MCFQQQPDEESAAALTSVLNHIFTESLPTCGQRLREGKANQNLMYARVAILAEAVRMSQFMESKALLSVALSKVRMLRPAAVGPAMPHESSQRFTCADSLIAAGIMKRGHPARSRTRR